MKCSKCCWKSEAVAQQCSAKVKLMFSKLYKSYNKASLMESLFRKTESRHACLQLRLKGHDHWHCVIAI